VHGTPADGVLQVGYIIVAVDGQPIDTMDALIRVPAAPLDRRPGQVDDPPRRAGPARRHKNETLANRARSTNRRRDRQHVPLRSAHALPSRHPIQQTDQGDNNFSLIVRWPGGEFTWRPGPRQLAAVGVVIAGVLHQFGVPIPGA
jgi:hypothetical protein